MRRGVSLEAIQQFMQHFITAKNGEVQVLHVRQFQVPMLSGKTFRILLKASTKSYTTLPRGGRGADLRQEAQESHIIKIYYLIKVLSYGAGYTYIYSLYLKLYIECLRVYRRRFSKKVNFLKINFYSFLRAISQL